jgi:signal transduction histidine kinase/CHASE2 domain-containing sensor protein
MKWHFREIAWRLFPGGLAAAGFGLLLHWGVLQPLETVAHTALFRARGETPWDDRVVLVKIDDNTVKKLGRFPFSRQYYGQLIDRLTDADAAVIAIDILFSEPSPEDRQLAMAMARSQRVILAQDAKQDAPPLLPIPSLQEAAIGSGHIRVAADANNVVRHIEPQVRGDLAFGVAAVETYSLVREVVVQPDLSRPIVLNWAASQGKIQQYSFADVVSGSVNPQVFRHKIVLVGVTATGFDVARTPFDFNPPASGVHLQATLMHNLLRHNALYEIDPYWLLLLLLGPGLSLLLSRWRTEIQTAIALTLTLTWGGLGLGLLLLGYLIPVAFPISLIVTTTIIAALTERLRINAILQQQVQQLSRNYQSDLVLVASETEVQKTQIPSMQRVTQLSALADQLGRSQATQAAIARTLPIGLVAADYEGRVWFCNPVSAELLQIGAGERLAEALIPHWVSAEDWQQFATVLHTGTAIPVQEKFLDQRWYSLQLEPLTYQPHEQSKFKLDGILLLVEDISDRKKVEANLDEQIAQLNQLNQLKDDFISAVSHELRTPLTNMKMAIQLLKVIKSEPQREQYIEILDNECNRETRLINELLDLQRLDAGRVGLHPETIQLQSWLPEVVTPFYQRTEARQQSLSIAVDEAMPALLCDRSSLERILAELMNNACKYTPPDGEILVMADDVDSQVEFRVSNSGSEIPAAARSRIFERFYRVPDADIAKQDGTGLGLALVKKLVEYLDGEIHVESADGWTTFTVQLPLAPLKEVKQN